jgi:hypothetical protein
MSSDLLRHGLAGTEIEHARSFVSASANYLSTILL